MFQITILSPRCLLGKLYDYFNSVAVFPDNFKISFMILLLNGCMFAGLYILTIRHLSEISMILTYLNLFFIFPTSKSAYMVLVEYLEKK